MWPAHTIIPWPHCRNHYSGSSVGLLLLYTHTHSYKHPGNIHHHIYMSDNYRIPKFKKILVSFSWFLNGYHALHSLKHSLLSLSIILLGLAHFFWMLFNRQLCKYSSHGSSISELFLKHYVIFRCNWHTRVVICSVHLS